LITIELLSSVEVESVLRVITGADIGIMGFFVFSSDPELPPHAERTEKVTPMSKYDFIDL